MTQLIKLENYISRYEKDPFHYPGQFIRLKQENWKKLIIQWELQKEQDMLPITEKKEEDMPVSRWKKFFQRREQMEETTDDSFTLPTSKQDLKQYFLDTLLPFQLKWASTTINEMSFLDRYYYEDLTLRYFLQRFPDTFFLLYNPVFKLKNATIDAEIILITPVGITIISMIERPSSVKIIAGDDRTWYTEENNIQTKFLSPILGLKRTETVIKSILGTIDTEFPVKKIVLSRTNDMEFQIEPYLTQFIGKGQHETWLQEQRNLVSPLKYTQLKVADALLSHCDSVAVKRPEWQEEEMDDFSPLN
ncbi:nuclease-related domain-containing protein [Paraliobacillus ryukyuensis]|uniref:nuclease-related domain-containing protein n=1 Tax=Paraliobacillus ryukyuensis TaxID=200904 RepID=UPI0009A59B01|nr:NERD domain-containing protein [Paraliobacillus ryukyuensis]